MTSTARLPLDVTTDDDDDPRVLARPPHGARDDAARADRDRRRRRLRLRQHPGHAGRPGRAGHPAGGRSGDECARSSHRLADTGVRVLDVELARIGPDDEPDEYRRSARGRGRDRRPARHRPAPRSRPRPGHRATSAASATSPSTSASRSTSSSPRGARPGTSPRPPPSSGRSTGPTPGSWSTRSTSSGPARRSTSCRAPAGWFHFVQLCDAPADVPPTVDGVIHTARSARSLLGYGGLPLPDLLDQLPAGPYSLEVPNDVLRRRAGDRRVRPARPGDARAVVASHGHPAMAKCCPVSPTSRLARRRRPDHSTQPRTHDVTSHASQTPSVADNDGPSGSASSARASTSRWRRRSTRWPASWSGSRSATS